MNDEMTVVEEDKIDSKVGDLLRGQAWVELHGIFYPAHLRALADQIEKNCQGLEKKNGNTGGNNS